MTNEVTNASCVPARGPLTAVPDSFQTEPSEAVLRRFRGDLLAFIRDQGADSVVMDLSGIRVLDVQEFGSLKATLDMARLLGVNVVVTGLRPGVVAAMVELDLDFAFPAGLDLDQGFDIVRRLREEGSTR